MYKTLQTGLFVLLSFVILIIGIIIYGEVAHSEEIDTSGMVKVSTEYDVSPSISKIITYATNPVLAYFAHHPNVKRLTVYRCDEDPMCIKKQVSSLHIDRDDVMDATRYLKTLEYEFKPEPTPSDILTYYDSKEKYYVIFQKFNDITTLKFTTILSKSEDSQLRKTTEFDLPVDFDNQKKIIGSMLLEVTPTKARYVYFQLIPSPSPK